MTNKKMLEELIKLAEKNGYHFWNASKKHIEFIEDEMIWQYKKGHGFYASVADLLFDHKFAKAIFGEVSVCPICGVDYYCDTHGGDPEGELAHPSGIAWTSRWIYFIKQLAITPEEDRIKYAYKNRKK